MRKLLLLLMLGALPSQALQTKFGSIEGTVTSFGARVPVVNASVVLQGSQFGPRRTATTDANGRFSFPDMAPGTYAVVAEREGYLAEDNGRFTETVAIATVTVREAASTQLSFKLLRTSIIRGRITDDDGNPKGGLSVDLLRMRYDALGQAAWQLRNRATTDDRGEYQFTGLIPGDYYLRSGQMFSAATRSSAGNAQITYYPGTASPLAAAPVALQEGDERIADFKEQKQTTYTVRGRVINSLPNSENALLIEVKLLRRNSATGLESPASLYLPQRSDGRFEIAGVTPGTYDLLVIGEVWKNSDATRYISRLPVQVRDEDIENISLTLKPGVDVRGRLMIQQGDGRGVRFAAPFSPGALRAEQGQLQNSLRLYLLPKDMDASPIAVNASNPEGTGFTVSNVQEGEYAIQVVGTSVMPFPTYVAEIFSGARNVLTDGFLVGTEPVSLDVLVRSDGGTVEASVSSSMEGSVLVVLAPSPQKRNNTALYSSATTRGSGTFRLNGVPPGEYKLFAWEGMEAISTSQPYMNADYIARYESRGVPVKVEANSTVTGIKVVAIPFGQ